MKSLFRPTTPDDAGGVREFLQRAFDVDAHASFLRPDVLAWKYWDHRGDWEGPRAYVLERDGAIVAHAGIYPMVFDAGAIRGVHMIDWASDRAAPGAGLALLQKLNGLFDFIYASGGSEMTRKVLPAFGFVEVTRQWRGARPIRPVRQVLGHQTRGWRRAPRLVRNLAWSLEVPAVGSGAWNAVAIEPAMLSNRFASVDASDASVSPRSSAFFDYLSRCPAVRIRTFRMTESGVDRGHFALGVLRGQARLAGVWLHEPDSHSWRAAFTLARHAARNLEGANEFVCAGTRGQSERAAEQAGLRVVGTAPVYLLNRKGKLALRDDFQFQLADNDGAFLDDGVVAYWT